MPLNSVDGGNRIKQYYLKRHRDCADNTDENSSVFSLIQMRWLQGHVGSKTLHQKNPQFLTAGAG